VAEGLSREELMRYLDGEASPDERARIDAALEDSTELQRDVTLFGKMKEDLQTIRFENAGHRSVWYGVHKRITRPVGWLLLITGFALWTGYGSYLYMVSAIDPVEKLASTGIVLGLLLLLGSVVYERYRDWLTDPYRDILR
jgi:putative zinc finger protein